MNEDAHYQLLKLLEQNPQASQRELGRESNVSLGKMNYCLKALIGKGHVKVENFLSSDNKASYLYLLTPKGIKAKAKISVSYLHRKVAEYEALKTEIEQLESEVSEQYG